ncbi:ABC transporter ATP-binding protein [Cohnella nanjingensis]|uniref:ABC transporter ATP-binding protein n=1 Tax=Cohnella nanjingensis TaxID=1387779 RepID=A0A7X0RVR3_9BACL|nr:ABC transporter ATP-binding protein [Cohnella nanjingensis]MBB6673260.1 ABC transporter ATP-binding protein [Cohnella nanjingensis]
MNEQRPLMEVEIREAGYESGKPILRDVAFDIRPGERVGLLGPNGAGKSTIMKGLLGQLPHWRGTVAWPGRGEAGVRQREMSSRIAYIPEQPILYERFTLWEHLQLAAAVSGISEAQLRERSAPLLRRFRLDRARHDYPIRFSKGMQQKVMLVVAFLLEPELFLVDEPFIGLDPAAVMELLEALDEERRRGAAVLLTTHVLDSAERLCDRFVLVHAGGVAAKGTLPDIRAAAGSPDGTPLFDCFRALTTEGTGS